jgi:vacuolar-type H+-ATPase subunit F/Vma7
MGACAFIGDEVSAAGFRLTGVAVHVPTPAALPGLFEALCGEAELILLTAEVADWLPAERLRAALQAARPLVLVVADIRGQYPPPDVAAALRRQLGMGE